MDGDQTPGEEGVPGRSGRGASPLETERAGDERASRIVGPLAQVMGQAKDQDGDEEEGRGGCSLMVDG